MRSQISEAVPQPFFLEKALQCSALRPTAYIIRHKQLFLLRLFFMKIHERIIVFSINAEIYGKWKITL